MSVARKRCQSIGCKRLAAPKRRVCLSCKSRLWRKQNPLRAAYVNARAHAKARGAAIPKSFTEWDGA